MESDPLELQNILDNVEEIIYHQDIMKVVDMLENSRTAFEAGPDDLHTAFLLKMGWANTRRRRMGEGRENYQQALAIIERNPGDDEWLALRQEYMWGLGRLLRFSGEVDQAIAILEEALELRPGAEDLASARPHLDIAPMFSERGNMSEALNHYREGIRILETTDKLNELARSYNNISDAYIKTGDYATGLEFADKCIKLSGEIGNTRVAGFGAMNGGEALVRLGEATRARDYLRMCREAWADTNNDYELGSLKLLEGMIETQDGNFQQAEDAFDEADIYMEGQERRFYSARVKHEYGILFIMKGDLELAHTKLKEAETVLAEFNWEVELDSVRDKIKEIEATLKEI